MGTAEPAERAWGAVDMGSSSVKLLVLGRDDVVLADKRMGTNLGRGLGPGGLLPYENQQRAMQALATLVAAAWRHGVVPGRLPVIATAAVRNAPNGRVFITRLHDELGLRRARVLSGDEEAQLGYRAALLGLPDRKPGRHATLDLGGGSFQLAIGDEQRMERGASTQVGSNRVQEELLAPGVLTPADFARADEALVILAPLPLPIDELRGRRFIGLGGIALFLRARFGPGAIPRCEIERLRENLGALTPEERAADLLRDLDKERRVALGVDTAEGQHDQALKLPAKLTVLLHILRLVGLDALHVSVCDARHVLIHDDRGVAGA